MSFSSATVAGAGKQVGPVGYATYDPQSSPQNLFEKIVQQSFIKGCIPFFSLHGLHEVQKSFGKLCRINP